MYGTILNQNPRKATMSFMSTYFQEKECSLSAIFFLTNNVEILHNSGPRIRVSYSEMLLHAAFRILTVNVSSKSEFEHRS